MPRPRRRERLRQDDVEQGPVARHLAEFRQHHLQRPRHRGRRAIARRRCAEEIPPQGAIHFPGSVRLAQSADDGVRHRQRAARHPRHRQLGIASRDGARAHQPRRSRRASSEALSAQLFGRPAPAHRHCARARPQTRPHHLRRAGLGARRVDPGADPQPADGSEAATRPDLSVHLAQPRRHRLYRRPHRRDVRGPHRRAGAAPHPVAQSDLERRLDIARLLEDKSSRPDAWPPPFRRDAEQRPDLIDLGDGHFVQASAMPSVIEAAQ